VKRLGTYLVDERAKDPTLPLSTAGPSVAAKTSGWKHCRWAGQNAPHYWFSGQSGTGKTTIARLIASEVAEDWNTEEVDATDLSAARLRELERASQSRGLGAKSGQAFIVNEAHGLNKAAVRQLLTTLERVPAHVV
jgi:replication-associated recombination protein RarA